jgi:hypothetical protein
VAGKFGQVDGDDRAQRYRDAQGHQELVSVPDSSTMMPKCASSNSGVHWVSVRKVHSGTLLKNTSDSRTRM